LAIGREGIHLLNDAPANGDGPNAAKARARKHPLILRGLARVVLFTKHALPTPFKHLHLVWLHRWVSRKRLEVVQANEWSPHNVSARLGEFVAKIKVVKTRREINRESAKLLIYIARNCGACSGHATYTSSESKHAKRTNGF
jgi:hypothetical protein